VIGWDTAVPPANSACQLRRGKRPDQRRSFRAVAPDTGGGGRQAMAAWRFPIAGVADLPLGRKMWYICSVFYWEN